MPVMVSVFIFSDSPRTDCTRVHSMVNFHSFSISVILVSKKFARTFVIFCFILYLFVAIIIASFIISFVVNVGIVVIARVRKR